MPGEGPSREAWARGHHAAMGFLGNGGLGKEGLGALGEGA